MNLHDYHQDFIVAGHCKLTFFCADEHHRRLLNSVTNESGPIVASLEELQDLKAIVGAFRSSSRDWLDLYFLAKNHGFGMNGWKRAFDKAGLTNEHLKTAIKRICAGRLPIADPGFKTLTSDAPSIREISEFFREAARQAGFTVCPLQDT